MTRGDALPHGTASNCKLRELKTTVDLREIDEHSVRDNASPFDGCEDMLNTLARAAMESQQKSSRGSSSNLPSRSSALAPLVSEADRVPLRSEREDAGIFGTFEAESRLSQSSGGSRQLKALSASDNAALLCSAVDLACLKEGLQARGNGSLGGAHFESSNVPTDSAKAAAGKPIRFLGGTDLAALQTVMADLSSAERSEFSAGGVFEGSSSSQKSDLKPGTEQRGGLSQQQQDEAMLSTSLFAKLLQECQANGLDLVQSPGGERQTQQQDSMTIKPEGDERHATFSPELVALLQQHHACRLSDKPEREKRLLASVSSTACNSSTNNSRRASSCSPDESGSEEARLYKRRLLEMHFREARRSSFSSSRSSSSNELRLLEGSRKGAHDGDFDALDRGAEGTVMKTQRPDSPTHPLSPAYLAELQLIERVASGDPTVFNEDTLTASTLRGPLGYYSVCEAPGKEPDPSTPRLYPVVRGVSRDNTKKRWAVYWKGYRRYFYDKFFESCIEAYRRAVQFRQQATTAAAAVAATGNPAHLIAAGLHGSAGGPGGRQLVKGDPSETVVSVLASAAAAVANQGNGGAGRRVKSDSPTGERRDHRAQDNDRAVVCLYKEAILFVLEDLRNNVLTQYLTSRAASTVHSTPNTIPQIAAVELAAATTAKRLLDQLLLVHTNMVGNATSSAELQPSLMIVAPCLEDLKLPSQQTSEKQQLLLQSILAMHIQQLLLLSRYMNKGSPSAGGIKEESGSQSAGLLNVKGEVGSDAVPPLSQGAEQDSKVETAPSANAVDVHA